ncbi:MAG: hypothetical protein A6D92_00555 [Symbiobacterium thermophilum]|uniref:Uncharacterized protein n=1 Tax=Symbiobacterium thermophilum TaxID=2734 RepID=A0A1Y2T951_SYMTR|nr:MAG: hypothetical protein A6D92_00555 [Symbiobacterium thermophilum]
MTKPSGRAREVLLDLLLAALVLTSVVLTVRIWYPEPLFGDDDTTEPSLQMQPVPIVREMPEIFRPERIVVARADGGRAELHAGSPTYSTSWQRIRKALTGLDVRGGATLIDQVPRGDAGAPSLELFLPTALQVGQWADLLQWQAPFLRNGSMLVDRVIVTLGERPAVYLSGPLGFELYLADLPEDQRAALVAHVERLDPTLFGPYRELVLDGLQVTAAPGLMVPDVKAWPAAEVTVLMPDLWEEEARYFPDLSVVRQIDEQDARSLTDGRRLLRITGAGVLQYRTAEGSAPAASPELEQALEAAGQWVGSRGGWPQDVVLHRYERDAGVGRLAFEVHTGGRYPVQSLPGAMQVHVSAAARVVYFERTPTVANVMFEEALLPLVPPEDALAHALPAAPLLSSEPVRAMYLTYLLRPPAGAGEPWTAEPTWVIQAGSTEVYVNAVAREFPLPPKVLH